MKVQMELKVMLVPLANLALPANKGLQDPQALLDLKVKLALLAFPGLAVNQDYQVYLVRMVHLVFLVLPV